MEDTQLFQEILGLKSPWIVSKINRNFEEKELILTVSYPQKKWLIALNVRLNAQFMTVQILEDGDILILCSLRLLLRHKYQE